METTALLAPLGHSARLMLLCAHLAWLTHFLDLEPVRAHPVSPEQHLFPYVNIFLFQPHCMLNDMERDRLLALSIVVPDSLSMVTTVQHVPLEHLVY
jgi:hypothetical protein